MIFRIAFGCGRKGSEVPKSGSREFEWNLSADTHPRKTTREREREENEHISLSKSTPTISWELNFMQILRCLERRRYHPSQLFEKCGTVRCDGIIRMFFEHEFAPVLFKYTNKSQFLHLNKHKTLGTLNSGLVMSKHHKFVLIYGSKPHNNGSPAVYHRYTYKHQLCVPTTIEPPPTGNHSETIVSCFVTVITISS